MATDSLPKVSKTVTNQSGLMEQRSSKAPEKSSKYSSIKQSISKTSSSVYKPTERTLTQMESSIKPKSVSRKMTTI